MPTAQQPQLASQLSPQALAGRTYRMIRRTHGMTLAQVAELVGITESHLSRIERGERAISPDLQKRFVEVYGSLPMPEEVGA